VYLGLLYYAEAKTFRLYLGTWPELSDWCNRPFDVYSRVGFCFAASCCSLDATPLCDYKIKYTIMEG
jgi:hypothetical protein